MITNNIEDIVCSLHNEDIAALPTDTVYGLAGLVTSYKAVSKIYQLKNRPSFNPLIVHVNSIEQIKEFAEISDTEKNCMNHFWDNKKPLTIVLHLKKNNKITPIVTAGLKTIAVRMPHHQLMLEVIEKVGPVAAPSANASNKLSPTSPQHVLTSFKGNAPLILDGGVCNVGLESTIIQMMDENPLLLRAGGVSKEELETYFNCPLQKIMPDEKTIAPGQQKLHYSPGCPVVLNSLEVDERSVLLGFGPNAPQNTTINLSPIGDLAEAAHNLFEALHKLSLMKPKQINVMEIPEIGLGLAINDRLKRASFKA